MNNSYLNRYILYEKRIWRVTHILHMESTMPQEYKCEDILTRNHILYLKPKQIYECNFINSNIINRLI